MKILVILLQLTLFLSYQMIYAQIANISDTLISYYPFKYGNLNDILNISNNLTYNSTPDYYQVRDRLERDYEALQINNSLTLQENQNFNVSNGLTIFFRAQQNFSTYQNFSLLVVEATYGDDNNYTYFTIENNQTQNQSQSSWQSYAVSLHYDITQQLFIQTYINGTFNNIQYKNVSSDFQIQRIHLGTYFFQGHLVVDDFAIFNRNFSSFELQEIHNYPQDLIEIQSEVPSNVTDVCEENLKFLYSRNVTVDFEFINNEHVYTIDFGGFQLLENCYQTNLYLNGTHISHGIDPHLQSISASFFNNQSVSLGCLQRNELELECQFYLELLYQGNVQMTKYFTSIMSAQSLDNIQNGLQLSIVSDHSDQIKTIGQNVQTEVNICSDYTCSEYATTNNTSIIRNEISYIELKVTTPQYQSYFPVHKSLKLDNKEFLPENLYEVQNWNQTGRIIYQIKPHIASDDLLLLIQIGLVQNQTVNGTRRFLQEQEQPLETQDKLGDQDLVGKQIVINIIDKSDSEKEDSESDNTALVLGVTLGSVAFVSFSVSVVAFTVLKLKKLAILAEAAKVAPVPNTEFVDATNIGMNTPHSINKLQALHDNNV